MSKSKKKKAPTELKSKNITNDHPQEGLSTKDVSSKTKIAVRAAAGIGVVLTVIGIGILINRKLNLTKLLPTPTARQTRLLANEVAKAMGEESARAANDAMTSAKQVHVDSFLRNLPENRKASEDAKAYARSIGVKLAEHQTVVRPQVRHYERVA